MANTLLIPQSSAIIPRSSCCRQSIVKINDTSSVLLLCGRTVMYKCSDWMTYITMSLIIRIIVTVYILAY